MNKQAIEKALLDHWNNQVPSTAGLVRSVKILMWGTEDFGPRVAEVGFYETRDDSHVCQGSCFMQGDADGLLVCALVERLLIEDTDPMIDGPNEASFEAVYLPMLIEKTQFII